MLFPPNLLPITKKATIYKIQSIINTNSPIGISGTKLLIIIAIPLKPPAAMLLG